ncbi:MAG: 50S ribosomal protein L30e [Candidatus Hadarchaeia archaeon]
MTVNEELREAERTGKVLLGSNQSVEATKEKESRLTVLSTTCPFEVEEKVRRYSEEKDVPVYYYEGGGNELGLAFGKPFSVAAAAIIEPGDSSVLEVGESFR